MIYTIAPSYRDENTIWAGTDDGLIHVTRDGGKTWKDVTPPQLTPWAKVSLMDASHFDANSAYAAINTLRLDDLRPHIYRTHDGGKSWQHITAGIPDGGIINVVRDDPERRGLLFAGTEQAVYVSFDDGDHWQSLRLNMPATSIRDLVIKDDDLVVGTHGRSFWILDDITPLRQTAGRRRSPPTRICSQPQPAWRFRWNKNTDTPLPPDEPARRESARRRDHQLLAEAGRARRRSRSRFSTPPARSCGGTRARIRWRRPSKAATRRTTGCGRRRRCRPEPGSIVSCGMCGTSGRPSPLLVSDRGNQRQHAAGTVGVVGRCPGNYTVRLTANGKALTAPLVVKMDPRVKATPDAIKLQYDTSRAIDGALRRVTTALQAPGANRDTLARLQGQLSQLFSIVEQSDAAPVSQVMSAVKETLAAVDAAVK